VTRALRNLKAAGGKSLTPPSRWYEEQRRGLGGKFFDAITHATALIQAQPEAGALSRDRRTRRVLVHGFPYQVVYRLWQDEIIIVAIAHLLRLRGIALALRGPPVFRGFQAKPALIERRYSSKQSPRQAGALLYVRIKPQAVRATMPFTIEDFRDLVRILEEKPEWRAEVRRLILTDELLALPERVERGFLELTEAAKRHDEQIAEMRAEMDRRFAETDRRFAETDRRFGELIAEMDRRFAETDRRFAELIAETERLRQEVDQKFAVVIVTLKVHGDQIGDLKGMSLERQYADHAPSYFRPIMRRLHKLSSEELAVIVDDAIDAGQITAREGDDLIAADIVIRGRRTADQSDAYLVVEVSWGVGKDDVERAARRAAILAKLGIPALAAVAGEFVTADAAELARTQGVWQVMDGRVIAPESPSS